MRSLKNQQVSKLRDDYKNKKDEIKQQFENEKQKLINKIEVLSKHLDDIKNQNYEMQLKIESIEKKQQQIKVISLPNPRI